MKLYISNSLMYCKTNKKKNILFGRKIFSQKKKKKKCYRVHLHNNNVLKTFAHPVMPAISYMSLQ